MVGLKKSLPEKKISLVNEVVRGGRRSCSDGLLGTARVMLGGSGGIRGGRGGRRKGFGLLRNRGKFQSTLCIRQLPEQPLILSEGLWKTPSASDKHTHAP